MSVIQNKINQPLMAITKDGKNIYLSAKGSAQVSDEEISTSPHLQNLLAKGDIVIIRTSGVPQQSEESSETEKKTMKKTSKIGRY